jgi:hypothetical protein
MCQAQNYRNLSRARKEEYEQDRSLQATSQKSKKDEQEG